jgi:hypothetical protein
MTLPREIQSDVVNNVEISTILRKCKILATRLGNEEFKRWVEFELNGYTSKDDLPEYRVLKVESHGNFIGVAWQFTDIPIPPSSIPEKYRDIVTTVYFMDPIVYYHSLITSTEGSTDLSQPWPADLISLVGAKIYKNMNCSNAWKVISRGTIASLLDQVRNRVLSFALEIEGDAPNAGEAPPNTKPVSDERVAQVFNTVIQGNVGNIAAGSQTITYDTEITVNQNDLGSLKQYLASLGIGKKDLEELDQAVREDRQSKVRGDLGEKVKGWLGRMISKAGSSSWKIATHVAANLLVKAISAYYVFE